MKVFNVKSLLSAVSICLTLASTSFAGDAITPGKYVGKGSWKDQQGNSGHYDVVTTVLPNKFASSYVWPEGGREFAFDLSVSDNGFYQLVISGRNVGSMYCGHVQCHLDFPQAQVEETITFYDGHLYKIGSKPDGKGGKLMWQEMLEIHE